MSDELPAEEGGAPTTEPTTDWEQRYKDTHANWNTLNERFSKFEKDPNALIEFIQEKHPDLLVDDEPEEEDTYEPDEDEQPLTRAEWKAWQAEQEQAARQKAGEQQFDTDLRELVGDRELSEYGLNAIRYAASQGDIRNKDDLQKAVEGWFEHVTPKEPAKRPRAPHVVTGGQASTGTPDYSQMSRTEADRAMAERAMGMLHS